MGSLNVDQTTALWIVLTVTLVVWLGIWGYLWFLHGRIRRLEQEMRRRESLTDQESAHAARRR